MGKSKVRNSITRDQEIWKPIQGYEGLYEVSNLGRVKSLERMVNHRYGQRTVRERILKNRPNKRGYHVVLLSENDNLMGFCVHKLVLSAFKEKPKNKPQGNHIDGNKDNNRLSNLEWVTNQENMDHAIDTGLMRKARGINHGLSKLSKNIVLEMRSLKDENTTYDEIADMFNVNRTTAERAIKAITGTKRFRQLHQASTT